MSKLLLAEAPLVLLPTLAKEYGILEALFLQQLHYWQQKSSIEHQGKKWVYNTMDQWLEQIPCCSGSTFERMIARLKQADLISIEKLSSNKINRTNYYSLNYATLQSLIDQVQSRAAATPPPQQKTAEQPKRTYPNKTRKPIALPEVLDGKLHRAILNGVSQLCIFSSALHVLLGIQHLPAIDWINLLVENLGLQKNLHYQHRDANTPYQDTHLNLLAVHLILLHINNARSQFIANEINKLLANIVQTHPDDIGGL